MLASMLVQRAFWQKSAYVMANPLRAIPTLFLILSRRINYLKIIGVFSSQRPHISIASTSINRFIKALKRHFRFRNHPYDY